MNAMLIRSFGGPDVLEPAEVPRPEAGPGEVLIRVRAAAINPVDYKIRSGHYQKQSVRLPAVLGRDVAGAVAALGQGVTGYKLGDAVYAFLAENSGGYAQYAVGRENEVAPMPTSLDDVHAAAVPLAGTTAWQALFDHGRLQPGQRVLIHGAAGGVGHFAVQFAKAKGATVVATCSTADVSFVTDLGADTVIDYTQEDFVAKAGPVDLVIDLIGGETQQRSWALVRKGGAMVSTLQQPSEEEAHAHQARAVVFMAKPRREQLMEMGRLIDAGQVRVLVQHTHALDEAPQAHEKLEHEHAMGKTVLTVP